MRACIGSFQTNMGLLIMLTVAVCYSVIPMTKADVCRSNVPPQYQFYPNVTSRSSFVQCLNNSGTYDAVSYTCPDGLVFRPRNSRNDVSPLCVSNSGQYGTATFDCSRNRNGNGSYSGDKTLYATCEDGVPIDLHQCPLGEYLDDETLLCSRSCTATRMVGIFPTADGGYYTCTYDYEVRKWVMTSHSCGDQEKYNSDYQFCLMIQNSTTPATPTESTSDVVPSETTSEETGGTSPEGGDTSETAAESLETTQITNAPPRSGGGNILSKLVGCIFIIVGDGTINTCDL